MTSSESAAFVLDDGMQVDGASVVPAGVVEPKLPITEALFPPKTVYMFSPSLPWILRNSFPTGSKSSADGDKCLTIQDGRPCHFV